jgi:hypothetical protein
MFSRLIALAVAVLCSSGCERRNVPQAAPKPGTNAPAVSAWRWEQYPPALRMRLAQLPCQLLPKSSITMVAPLMGVLRVNVSSPQTNLDSGTIWSEFEPKLFEAEAKAIEEARVRLEDQERIQLELELPKQKLRLQRELEESQRQFAFVRLLATNPSLASMALTIPGQGANPLRPEAVGRAEIEVGLLERSLGFLQSTNLALMGIDLVGQRSEWQRRKLEFERRQSQARLRMPFKGQLTIALPLTEGVEEYPVTSGQELAVARDLSQVRLRLSLANPAWVGLAHDKLSAVLRLPSGEEVEAPFAFQKIERVQNREESVLYFTFPEERSKVAARLIGTDVACELWVKLPEPVRIVPKLTLVLQHPSAFQGRTWAQGVSALWPGAQVRMEGQTELAIQLPHPSGE